MEIGLSIPPSTTQQMNLWNHQESWFVGYLGYIYMDVKLWCNCQDELCTTLTCTTNDIGKTAIPLEPPHHSHNTMWLTLKSLSYEPTDFANQPNEDKSKILWYYIPNPLKNPEVFHPTCTHPQTTNYISHYRVQYPRKSFSSTFISSSPPSMTHRLWCCFATIRAQCNLAFFQTTNMQDTSHLMLDIGHLTNKRSKFAMFPSQIDTLFSATPGSKN